MASIASTGLGSGIDIEKLVTALTNAERAPVKSRLDFRQKQIEADLSAYKSLSGAVGSLRASLSSIADLSSLTSRSATSSKEDVFTVSATSDAVVGVTKVEVEQLASAHKLVSSDFATPDDAVGQGTLTIAQGSESFNVTIDNSNNTLSGIRDAINEADNNSGVKASIITVDDTLNPGETVSKLVLTAKSTGAEQAISIDVTNDADANNTDNIGLSKLAYGNGTNNLTELTAAQDAKIKVDGFAASSSNNTFSGVLPGVTINAISADAGNQHDLNVSLDKSNVVGKIKGFVASLNAYRTTNDFLTKVDVDTNQAGLLTGDSTARMIENQISKAINSQVTEGTGNYKSLGSIGISFDRNTKQYVLDESVLNKALDNDLDAVGNLIAGENGIAKSLDKKLDAYLDSGGIMSSVNKTLQTQLDDISKQRESLADRVNSVEARLRKQFTNMDIIVGQFNNTGDYIKQQLDAISPSNSKK